MSARQGAKMAGQSGATSGEPYRYILDACQDCWDGSFVAGFKNSDNCSGFVKAVAKKIGVQLPADARADDLLDYIDDQDDWYAVDNGVDAARWAAGGDLVLVGLRAKDHSRKGTAQGHIAVVVPGPLYHRVYPLVWCGSTGTAQSKGTKSVGEVWARTDRDNVSYYSR